MKKIYVTGIAGLLGSNIARELKDLYDVTGADRNDVDVYGIDYDVFDLLDETKLRESIVKHAPDIIIHTVALINVDLCQIEPELAKEINSELTKTVSKIAKEIGSKFIYISTDAVFDGRDNRLYKEEDIVNPINVYGETKLLGEKYALELSDVLVVRTNIYGVNIRDKKSFGEWVVSSLREGKNLNMFTDIYFSPILVNELAQILHLCIQKELKGVYHICGTGAISKYEFGVCVKNVFGIETGTINLADSSIMEFKAPRSKNMGMSNEKICNDLGIHISTPEESIYRFASLYED